MAAELIDGRRRRRTRSTGGCTRACRTGKLELLARGLANVERFDGGLLTRDPPHARGLRARRAPRRATPRASSTTCARSRAPRSPGSCATCSATASAPRARSRCARPTTASTCRAIARARAAAATAGRPASRPTLDFPRAGRVPAGARSPSSSELPTGTASCSSTSRPGSPRTTSSRGCGGGSARGVEGRPRGHARPVRHRAAARAGRPRHARAAVPDGAAQDATRRSRGSAGRRRTGDPEGEIAPGRMPAEPLALPTGRAAPAPAGLLGGQGRRRARLRAGAPRGGGRAGRARGRGLRASSSSGATDERAAFAIECSSGTYVRSLIADLGDAYCLELRRTRDRPVRRRRRRPRSGSSRSTTRSRSCPAVALRRRRRARAGARRGGCPATAEGTVRLLDDDGLIALAEPREDGTLKPVVGFRG